VAFTKVNIKAGWRVTGLWPFFLSKPLISPLLLKNANKLSTPQAIKVSLDVCTLETLILKYYRGERVVWSTLRRARDYIKQARRFTALIKAVLSDRLFLRKVGKAMDN